MREKYYKITWPSGHIRSPVCQKYESTATVAPNVTTKEIKPFTKSLPIDILPRHSSVRTMVPKSRDNSPLKTTTAAAAVSTKEKSLRRSQKARACRVRHRAKMLGRGL